VIVPNPLTMSGKALESVRGLSLGCSPPSGTGLFWGDVCPQVPLHLRRGGHLGLFVVWPLRGRLATIAGALPDMAKGFMVF